MQSCIAPHRHDVHVQLAEGGDSHVHATLHITDEQNDCNIKAPSDTALK